MDIVNVILILFAIYGSIALVHGLVEVYTTDMLVKNYVKFTAKGLLALTYLIPIYAVSAVILILAIPLSIIFIPIRELGEILHENLRIKEKIK